MGNAKKKDEKLEILLSTKDQTILEFLTPIFSKISTINFTVLVINQTQKGQELTSNLNHVKIINTYTKGLSVSRNLALKHATGDICLLADDDIKYVDGFSDIILNAFKNNPNFDVLTFMMSDFKGNLSKVYNIPKQHNYKTLVKANSVTIAFKRQQILDTKVTFDINFGLGSTFEIAEEFIWLRSLYKSKLLIGFVPKLIVQHPFESTGRFGGKDKIVRARAALFYKYSKQFAHLKLMRYLYLMLKTQQIQLKDVLKKYRIGSAAIQQYKTMLNSKH